MSAAELVPGGDHDGVSAQSGLLRSQELVRQVLSRPGYAFSDAELLENLRAVQALAAVAEAVKLALVAELDARPGAVPGAARGAVAVTFLTEGLRQSRPHAVRDVAAATALAPAPGSALGPVPGSALGPVPGELAQMGAALAAGEVSREHVDVAVSTLRRIPKVLKTKRCEGEDGVWRTGAQVIDGVLTGQARRWAPSTVERLGRQLVARLDPDRADRFNADAFERRSCTIGTDFAGMGLYRCVLDPATHAQVAAAITRWSAPRPAGHAVTPDGEQVSVKDARTPGQRRADAVAGLILAGAATNPATPASQNTTSQNDTQPDTGPQDAGPDTGPQDAGPDAEPPDAGPDAEPRDAGPDAEPRDAGPDAEPQDAGPDARPQGGEPQGRAGTPAGVFMARAGAGMETCLVATIDQFAAAFGAGDPAALGAGLARMGLAGTVGTYPGATLDPAVLARLACDSPIRRVLLDEKGAVLQYGRAQRLASTHQKRALAVRDGGCVIPGCHAPPEWSDAHHVISWEQGGVTGIDNLVLLCGRHHTAHHAGVYDLQIRDGVAWVRLPSWQHPERPWLRNTTHDHHQLADTTTAALLTGHLPLPPRDPDTRAAPR